VTGPRPDQTTRNFVAAQTKRLTQAGHGSGLQGNAGDFGAPGEAIFACSWAISTCVRIALADLSVRDHEFRLTAGSQGEPGRADREFDRHWGELNADRPGLHRHGATEPTPV
jgi:hypothetical protein